MNEGKYFFELFKEDIEEYIDENISREEMINNIFDSKLNKPQKDKPKIKFWGRSEVEHLLNISIEYLLTFEDRCSKCIKSLEFEDYIVEYEPREYWGAICQEQVTLGYHCTRCNHEEEY
jgi:hypothetical protein